MYKTRLLLSAFVCQLILCSCSKPQPELIGEILYISKNSVVSKYNFESKKISKMFNALSGAAKILSISTFNKQEVLLEEFQENKVPVIKLLNLDSLETRYITEGRSPTVMSENGDFLFLSLHDDGRWFLMKSNINDIDKKLPIMWVPRPDKFESPRIIRINSDRYAFNAIGNRLNIVDFKSGRVEFNEAKDCIPLLWRLKSEELLCQNSKTNKKYFLDIEEGLLRSATELDEYHGFIILEDDYTVVSKMSQNSNMEAKSYIYSFYDRKFFKLMDQDVQNGSFLSIQ